MAETKGSSRRSGSGSRSPSRSSPRKRKDAAQGDGSPSVESRLEEAMAFAAADDEAPEHKPPICSVGLCPICMVVTAVGEARPDLVQHLLLASREVLLAVRSIIDTRLEGSAEPSRLERITIE